MGCLCWCFLWVGDEHGVGGAGGAGVAQNDYQWYGRLFGGELNTLTPYLRTTGSPSGVRDRRLRHSLELTEHVFLTHRES